MAKPRWADLVDSSQETAREEDSRHDAVRNLLRDDSYGGEADPEFESSQKGLNSRLAADVSLHASPKEVGPKDFAFLFNDSSKSTPSNEMEAVPALRKHSSGAAGSSRAAPAHDAASSSAGSVLTAGDARQKRRQPAATQVGQAPIGKRAKANRLASTRENPAAMASVAEVTATRESSLPESQPSAAVENQSEASSEDWQHREEKRNKAIVIVKATPEYQLWSAHAKQNPQFRSNGALGLSAADAPAPRTPNAADKTISKRRWEQEVQSWRAALKQWCEKHPPDSSST